jgi:hypothetical protein
MNATRIRSVIARCVWSAFSATWILGFALAGRLMRPSVQRWCPVGNGKVLVLSPHPDDDVIGCGGALLRHREGGHHVVLIEVSDGSASRSGGLLPDAMARQRAREATEAAHELGAELVWLGLREGQWEHGALTRILGELLQRTFSGRYLCAFAGGLSSGACPSSSCSCRSAASTRRHICPNLRNTGATRATVGQSNRRNRSCRRAQEGSRLTTRIPKRYAADSRSSAQI